MPSKNRPWYKGHRFSAYDGEAVRDRYVLLANDHEEIYNPDGLSTRDCLTFLSRPTSRRRSESRVLFGLSYDVAHWIRDLSLTQRTALYAGELVTFEQWQLQYFGRRIFMLRDLEQPKEKPTLRYYDVQGFFGGSFLAAVAEWIGEPDPLLKRGKRERGTWRHWSIDRIRAYNRLECTMLVELMDRVKAALGRIDPPITPRYWHGPGSLASWLLNRVEYLYEDFRYFTPRHVGPGLLDPFSRAYFGGRIELLRLGTVRNLWRYDLNSAYPWALCFLRPVTYQWTPVERWTERPQSRMSVWRVSWRLPSSARIGPLPFRSTDGLISYPLQGEGWYWWPEVYQALRMYGSRAIRVRHGLVNLNDGATYTGLRPTIDGLYVQRQALRAAGDPAERLLKLALNALYGKFAQRVGSGNWYCLPWAGWATSLIRARLLEAVRGHEQHIVSFSTDGIISDAPLPIATSDQLGGWDVAQYSQGTFILPGLYRVKPPHGAAVRHTRSYDPGQFSWASVLRQLEATGRADVPVKVFVGHQLADQQPDRYADRRLTFVADRVPIDPYAIHRKRVGAVAAVEPGFRWRTQSIDLGAILTADHAPADGLSAPSELPADWDRTVELIAAGELDAAV